MRNDPGLETLLELNGNIIQQEHGFWFKDSYQLLQDFFADVDRKLKEVGL
jgi:hypothetical protein